eukprot:251832-Rhodomonas_salina.2
MAVETRWIFNPLMPKWKLDGTFLTQCTLSPLSSYAPPTPSPVLTRLVCAYQMERYAVRDRESFFRPPLFLGHAHAYGTAGTDAVYQKGGKSCLVLTRCAGLLGEECEPDYCVANNVSTTVFKSLPASPNTN